MPRPMTITEKIFAAHAGKSEVAPGDNVWVDVDVLMTHDVCGPGTIGIFKQEFGEDAKVWDTSRIPIIPDHYIFTADGKCHRNIQILRDFVKEQGIQYYYDPDFLDTDEASGMPNPYRDPTKTSYKGVCHKALPEEGHCRPGEILLGTDSHTCTAGAFGQFASGVGNTDAAFVVGTGKTWLKTPPTMKFTFHGEIPPYLTAKDLILAVIGEIGVAGATYKTMYFAGEGIGSLTLEDRMTLTNMAIEAGGKNGVCDVDQKTLDYVNARSNRPAGSTFEGSSRHPDIPYADASGWEVYTDDPGASYCFEHEWDLSIMEPMVAKPHSPDNKDTARNCSHVELDQAYLGSCTGGKITDMIFAANILRGNSVKIPTFVVPGSTEVHQDMLTLGLDGEPVRDGEPSVYQALEEAGCTMGPSGCSACLGGPSDTFGRLNEPKACISSTNRNFPGRMGHKEAGVYLASPLTVAASALTGKVTDPREFVSEPILTGNAGVV
ncbi:3-isopropylmalate dehydratase large subunit [Algisphaera agarilytica]|uniref:3-isopropylmalate/(R)-2-methylmalate dehydratase large subunit n=1 Tax=Algisphaera agarilytica TaxID=1385975 RepID=A0A7X0H8V9_9BACT|nr:aconitase family protein [Algisphaera agarilytica]MBB6429955.1 3-isopropylmalate/(R)-2-methylmalate dehydratase large subunit [Algisphaera agarilytica]